MSITATPTLTLADVTVATAGTTGGLLAVDDVTIKWGRESLVDNATPATARLSVFDRTPGGSLARRTDLIGQPVTLGWSGSDGSTGVNFRGRVTDVSVRPHDGGWLLVLAASSKELDLGNITVPAHTPTWPQESWVDRLARIYAFVPAGAFAGGWRGPATYGRSTGTDDTSPSNAAFGAAALDASGKTVLELFRSTFQSMTPGVMVYDPAADWVTYAPRRQYRYGLAVAGMIASVLLVPVPGGGWTLATAEPFVQGCHLPASGLAYGGSLDQALEDRVTRVEVGWLDPSNSNSNTYATATAAGALEASIGRRTQSVDSVAFNGTTAARLAAEWVDLLDHEGRTPRLGSLGYSSQRLPLADAAHARLLLSGCEQGVGVYVAGSWLPALGVRPMFGFVGGSVTYTAGHWQCDLTPAPVVVDPYPYAAPPPPPLSAGSTTLRLADVDPSVTFGDLKFLDVPPGQTISTATAYRGNPT